MAIAELLKALNYKSGSIAGCSVVVQGFGNVGSYAAQFV